MASQFDTKVYELIDKLGCSIRFTYPVESGKVMCWVRDGATGEEYAKGEGNSEGEAAIVALTSAETSDKPLTQAQKITSTLADENARLRAELAALKGEPVAPPPVEVAAAQPAPKRVRKVDFA